MKILTKHELEGVFDLHTVRVPEGAMELTDEELQEVTGSQFYPAGYGFYPAVYGFYPAPYYGGGYSYGTSFTTTTTTTASSFSTGYGGYGPYW